MNAYNISHTFYYITYTCQTTDELPIILFAQGGDETHDILRMRHCHYQIRHEVSQMDWSYVL